MSKRLLIYIFQGTEVLLCQFLFDVCVEVDRIDIGANGTNHIGRVDTFKQIFRCLPRVQEVHRHDQTHGEMVQVRREKL